MIGFTELALEETPEGSTIRDDLQEVFLAGNRAKELVQQILAFARQSEEKTKPVRLSDTLTEVLKLLRPSTPTTIEIRQSLNTTAKIMGNSSQLNQIIMNLCTNAIHSLQKTGGTLEISLRSLCLINTFDGGNSELSKVEYLELTVSYNGPGVDPTIIDKIFEPYFTTKGVGEGTGMGLAMVKGIIESYSGNIRVESEPGVKTSFIVSLPVVTGKNFEVAGPEQTVAFGTERILLVDDEPPIARMGSRMLESLGYSVVIRTSSIEALELFREKSEAFDLVMTDMTMPSMTGDELTMELRKIRRDIPVILCTGYSNTIDEEGAKEIAIDAFVYKPFTRPDLAKTIRDVLDA
jgi:CheY-like chemotaxis protein